MAQQIAFKGGSKKGQERRSREETRGRARRWRLLIAAPLVIAVALFAWFRFRPKPPIVLDPMPTPQAALHAFWQALAENDLDRCLLLWPDLAKTYGGDEQARDKLKTILGDDAVAEVELEEAALESDATRAALSYTVTLKSGRKLTGAATLRLDQENKRWLITGGI